MSLEGVFRFHKASETDSIRENSAYRNSPSLIDSTGTLFLTEFDSKLESEL